MSVTLASIDLSAAVVGTSNTYDFSQVLASQALPLATQMNPVANAGMLMMFNESNSGLQLVFLDSQHQINFPAGAWRRIPITAADLSFKWKVTYQIPNPLATVLLIDYYRPGELIDEVGSLGNSPIGGSITTTTTQQLYAPDNTHFLDDAWDSTNLNNQLRSHNPTISKAAGLDLQYSDASGILHDGFLVDRFGNSTIANKLAAVNGLGADNGSTIGMGIVAGGTVIVRQKIATTALTVVESFTPLATGLYRVGGHLWLNNGTSGNVLTFRLTYTDPDEGIATNHNFWAISGAASLAFNGSNSFGNGHYFIVPYGPFPISANPVTINYQDPTNTPADYITLFFEQFA